MSRTLPEHSFFVEPDGPGQQVLFAVLKCMARAHPQIGYVQGMGYIAAILMTYTTMCDALLVLLSMFTRY